MTQKMQERRNYILTNVGITGGIGSGKTGFVKELGRLGASVIDVDMIARELVDERDDIQQAIRKAFGADIFNGDGRLKRRALGQSVFSNKKKLDILNHIIRSPLISVLKDRISHLKDCKDAGIIAVDMAILYEAEVESLFDIVVVVTASLKSRINWLSQSREWSREEILERMEAQMDVKQKILRADVVIENSGTLEELHLKARDLYSKIYAG